jgi:hypothetical protein
MAIKCECDCNCKFRVKNNRYLTAIFLTIGYTLSFLSDLDCFFVEVDVGFTPNNTYYDTSQFGIGLWSFEDPDNRGLCITPMFVNRIGRLTKTDHLYAQVWSNGDLYWTIARITASLGLILGFSGVMLVWVSLCITEPIDGKTKINSFLLVVVTMLLTCEGTKFGMFFESQPCNAQSFWEFLDEDEVSTFHKADTCLLSRGTYMSIGGLISYIIVIVQQLLVRVFPSYRHEEMSDGFDYDNVTMPSYLGSIGKSVTSKFSFTSSIAKSVLSRRSSALGELNDGAISHIMNPIVESDDEDFIQSPQASLVSGKSYDS